MTKTAHRLYAGSFFVTGIAVTILLAVDGWQYYTLPVEERFFNASHEILKPSGIWGHGFGIIGTLMMIAGVALYMVRKRSRKLISFGLLKYWLEFHIFLCSLGPVLVLYHTAFKFGGIVAVSFWSMVAVVLSGVVGRFLYVQIPRTISGQELSINELNEMNTGFDTSLEEHKVTSSIIKRLGEITATEKYKKVTLGTSFLFIIKDYIRIKQVLRNLKKELKNSGTGTVNRKEIVSVARAKLLLSRRIGLLRTSQKLFKYWHIVHLPFAIAMFVIMIIHVGVTIAFGYKWIF